MFRKKYFSVCDSSIVLPSPTSSQSVSDLVREEDCDCEEDRIVEFEYVPELSLLPPEALPLTCDPTKKVGEAEVCLSPSTTMMKETLLGGVSQLSDCDMEFFKERLLQTPEPRIYR